MKFLIKFKYSLPAILGLIFVLFFGQNFFYPIQKSFAQTKDNIVMDTTGYSVLSPSSYILNGDYSGDISQRGFTTYFEYKNGDSNLNDNPETTIEIKRNGSAKEFATFYSSPELKMFSTYYFRSVGYFNDDPTHKFYGNIASLETGVYPLGAVIPFTELIKYDDTTTVTAFNPTQILMNISSLNVTDTTADIKLFIYNEHPETLSLKVSYGTDKLDQESSVSLDDTGKISFSLSSLTPQTTYYYQIFDTTGKLGDSIVGTFTTSPNISTSEPNVVTSVQNISPTSVYVQANIYSKYTTDELQAFEGRLRIEYGENDFSTTSQAFNFNQLADGTVTLTNLKPGTTYKYRPIDTINTNSSPVLGEEKTFTTLNTPPGSTVFPPDQTTTAVSSGLVNCGTYDAQGKISNPCGFSDALGMINTVIKFIFLDLVVPFAAIMFAYAGFLLITSGGSTEQKSKAKGIFLNVAIGLIIAAAAFVIVRTVLSLLEYQTGTGWSWFGF
jgi:hypothetical protein